MDGERRILETKIKRLLTVFPVVVILGPRQCGKSTLAKMIGPEWEYFDLENPNHFERVEQDPVLFFREHSNRIIIDEAQKSPKLFETLRGVVDQKRTQKGRFILTGSASFELINNISESLAGRVGITELSPFKMCEFKREPLSDFFSIFEDRFSEQTLFTLKSLTPTKDFLTVKKYLLKGGYPEPVLSNDKEMHLDWMENYFETYINRDMRSLFPRLDYLKYRRVLSMLSSLSGTIINKSDIARSIEASEKATRDYIEIIEGTFFWRSLTAFTTPKIKTTLKLPKGHFRDSGLALFLQNIHSSSDLNNYPGLGRTFESFITEEVIRGIQATSARNLSFYHFRTKAGSEIDLLAEGSFGLCPIEIKYRSNVSRKQVTSLINFIESHNLPLGVVISNTEKPEMISEKVIQIPAGCL